jgi:hypothetical protein
LYVTEQVDEIGSEGPVTGWSWSDPGSQCRFELDQEDRLSGQHALVAHIDPYSGGRVTLVYRLPNEVQLPADNPELVFWLQARNPSVPAWQGPNPVVTLADAAGRERQLMPAGDFLASPPYNEAREGWTYFVAPLRGDERWKSSGAEIRGLQEIRIGLDSWGAPPLQIRLDGIAVR